MINSAFASSENKLSNHISLNRCGAMRTEGARSDEAIAELKELIFRWHCSYLDEDKFSEVHWGCVSPLATTLSISQYMALVASQ